MRLWWLLAAALLALLAAAAATEARLYWTGNLPGFNAGDKGTLVFTNMGPTPQAASVDTAAGNLWSATIAPGTSQQVLLPDPATTSGLRAVGYRVDAGDNVLVAQFNPINNVVTNDAYRLLSLAELGTDHWAFSHRSDWPTFIAVVGTQAGTTVTVTATAPVDVGVGVLPFGPGSQSFTLNDRDILTLRSAGDLTGSRVQSSAPVAVFSGAECTRIGSGACDHISEQVLPAPAAGTEFPVCASVGPTSVRTAGTDRLRILAGRPGATTLTFQPMGTTATLAGLGAWSEFSITSDQLVTASQPVLLAQLYGDSGGRGDPALVIHANTTNHRTQQQVHIPSGWDDFLQIVAPNGTASDVDGTPVATWRPIPTTGWSCAAVPVADGNHLVTSSAPVSVQVLGIQSFASYWYLGDVGIPPPPPPVPCHVTAVAPGAPEDFLVTQAPPGSQTAVLAWDPPASDGGCPILAYEVLRRAGSAAPVAAATLTGTPPPTTWTDTVAGTCGPYDWTVRATTAFGAGPWAPWQGIHLGTAPATAVPAVTAEGDGLRILWSEPDDGGCPLTRYRVEGASSGGATLRLLLDPTERTHAFPHDPCQGFSFRVQAENALGLGPLSAPATYVPPEAGCRPEGASDLDSDGDGVPDRQDDCPADPGACGGGHDDATEAPLGCTTRVDDVVAEPGADATVRLRWRTWLCDAAWITVWDDGRQVARLPAAEGVQSTLDGAPTPQTHLYHVQADAQGIAFDAAAAVPSNLIDLCGATPLLPTCPRAAPDPTSAAPPALVDGAADPVVDSAGDARAALPGWAWGVLVLAIVAVGGAVVATAVLRRRPPAQDR